MTIRAPKDPVKSIERLTEKISNLEAVVADLDVEQFPYQVAYYRRRIAATKAARTRQAAYITERS